jgi:hypothetical protein
MSDQQGLSIYDEQPDEAPDQAANTSAAPADD